MLSKTTGWVAPLLLLLVMVMALFAPGLTTVTAQEIDPTCTDGIDNDADTVIDGEDPSCTTLSEEPAVTPAPTAEPTAAPTVEPTVAPTPAPTPDDLPPTGGILGDNGTDGGVFEDTDTDPGDGGPVPAPDALATSAIAGFIVSMVVTGLAAVGLANSTVAKQAATTVLAIGAGFVLAATQDGVAIDNVQDVLGLIASAFGFATVAYVFVSKQIQEGIKARRIE